VTSFIILLLQMEITPVSQLRPGRLNYGLHVRISRMWEFRGTNEQNDIKHLDLVLIDQKVPYH
jgi:replication factor A1